MPATWHIKRVFDWPNIVFIHNGAHGKYACLELNLKLMQIIKHGKEI